MENQYNDGLIMSPDIMEQIAKEYNRRLAKRNVEDYEKIANNLKQIIIDIRTLEKVCSKNFFNLKKEQVKNLEKLLTCQYLQLCKDEIVSTTNYKINFCEILKGIIENLSCVIELCLSILKKHNDNTIDQCLLTCLLAIKNTVHLFGDCKYRSYF